MLFEERAELVKLAGGENDASPPATLATSATQCPDVAIVADVATHPMTIATSATPAQRIAPNVASVATPIASTFSAQYETAGVRATTWASHVVSLDEWQRLTKWQRHGPTGRRICQLWE